MSGLGLEEGGGSLPLFLGHTLLVGQAITADFAGKVVSVSDGDTIRVLHSPRH